MIVWSLVAWGCGRSGASELGQRPVELGATSQEIRLANEFVFADGTRVDGVHIVPDRLRWGSEATIAWRTAAEQANPAAVARISIVPAQDLRQEVAYGGQSVKRLEDDPRRAIAEVPWGEGVARLRLPAGFHDRTVVAMLERFVEGSSIPAVRGARSQGGAALVGVVPVDAAPTRLSAPRAAIRVDGRLDEAAWREAATPLVESLHGEPITAPATRVWFAWSDEALYMAARVDDDDVWSDFHQRDDPLWKGEAIELFIASDGAGSEYLEFQVNARQVLFDARFTDHRRGEQSWDSAVQVAVQVQGTLDERRDRDQGWTLELAVPWEAICTNTGFSCPPGPHKTVRINAFRLERPKKGDTLAFALSPTRVPDFHAMHNAATLELRP